MSRPDFEKLYGICFRQHFSMALAIQDLLDEQRARPAFTVSDIVQSLETILHKDFDYTPEEPS